MYYFLFKGTRVGVKLLWAQVAQTMGVVWVTGAQAHFARNSKLDSEYYFAQGGVVFQRFELLRFVW